MGLRLRSFAPLEDRGPLRVMFLITSMPVGGAETLLVNLVRRMDRERFLPSLACLKQLGPLGEVLAEEIPTANNLIHHKFDVAVVVRLVRLFRRQRIDAVVTVGAGDKMFWGRVAAHLAGVPVVLSALHSTGWPDVIGRLNGSRLLTRWTDAFIGVADAHGTLPGRGRGISAREGPRHSQWRRHPAVCSRHRHRRAAPPARPDVPRHRLPASWRRYGPKRIMPCSCGPRPAWSGNSPRRSS